MPMTLRQRTNLRTAIEVRQRLSRATHDRHSRWGDRIFLAAAVILILLAYWIVGEHPVGIQDIENHQRQAQR